MATEAVEAPAEEVEGEPKKKKPILLILVIVLSVIVLIMSVMFGTLYFSGFFEHKSEAAAHEKVDELEKAAEDAHGAAPSGPSKVKKEAEATRFENTYLEIDKEFMTNITSSKKIMVVKVAVMTHYDSRVFDNVKKHEFAIRSAVLDVMRQSTEADVAKQDFRVELAAKIKVVMNDMLMKYEDFGGIEDVFFTSFVMQ
ncbi:flagellar basal body-associated FliL family protein [Limnohabitans sp.]|jgi:flagellar FliL protein|uniref:flagellar basal body-associated FliL family protein n=1 Tax=Limnohabitans sp. TaxID=1907725 RepID=UPI00286EECDE|nr:flagellar basal body-associated FliL family protein [Limnohabitans sp.]